MNPPSEEDYWNARGMIVMCMYCQKTQCKWPNRDQWVLVEEFLAEPPSRVSHGLCPIRTILPNTDGFPKIASFRVSGSVSPYASNWASAEA
jgi:hypothetical protein